MYGATGTRRKPALMWLGSCGIQNDSTMVFVCHRSFPSLTMMMNMAVTPWSFRPSSTSLLPPRSLQQMTCLMQWSVRWGETLTGTPARLLIFVSILLSVCLNQEVTTLQLFNHLQSANLTLKGPVNDKQRQPEELLPVVGFCWLDDKPTGKNAAARPVKVRFMSIRIRITCFCSFLCLSSVLLVLVLSQSDLYIFVPLTPHEVRWSHN